MIMLCPHGNADRRPRYGGIGYMTVGAFLLIPPDQIIGGHLSSSGSYSRSLRYALTVMAAVVRCDHGVVWASPAWRSSDGRLDGHGVWRRRQADQRSRWARSRWGGGMTMSRRSRSSSGTVSGISPASRSAPASCWRWTATRVVELHPSAEASVPGRGAGRILRPAFQADVGDTRLEGAGRVWRQVGEPDKHVAAARWPGEVQGHLPASVSCIPDGMQVR